MQCLYILLRSICSRFIEVRNIKIRQYECFPKILHINSWLQLASKYSKSICTFKNNNLLRIPQMEELGHPWHFHLDHDLGLCTDHLWRTAGLDDHGELNGIRVNYSSII